MIRVQCLKSSRFPISIENVGEEWLKFRKKTSLFWVGKLLTCPKFFPSCLWSTVLVQSNAFCVLFRWAIELSNFVDISDIAAYKVCSWSIFRRLGIFKVSKIVLLVNSVMDSRLMPEDGQIQNLTTLETFSWQNMLHISYTQKEKLGFNKTGRARMTMPFRALLFSFFLSTKANNWPFSHKSSICAKRKVHFSKSSLVLTAAFERPHHHFDKLFCFKGLF